MRLRRRERERDLGGVGGVLNAQKIKFCCELCCFGHLPQSCFSVCKINVLWPILNESKSIG